MIFVIVLDMPNVTGWAEHSSGNLCWAETLFRTIIWRVGDSSYQTFIDIAICDRGWVNVVVKLPTCHTDHDFTFVSAFYSDT